MLLGERASGKQRLIGGPLVSTGAVLVALFACWNPIYRLPRYLRGDGLCYHVFRIPYGDMRLKPVSDAILSTAAPHPVTRRHFIKSTGITLAAIPMLGLRFPQFDPRIPIATQMWVVRNEAQRDLPGVLASLAELGYEGVEFADDYFGHTVEEVRALLDANTLKVAGNHVYLESLLGDRLAHTAEQNATLGARNLIVRSLTHEQSGSKEGILRFAAQLNEIAEKLEPYGMRVGFHNHTESFVRFDGELAWNILADNTRDDVILQLDTGNAMHAPESVNVAALVRRNPGRTVTTHIKPFSRADAGAYIGEDELDWKTILPLMETVGGTEWYIVEYEVEGPPPLEALRDNLALFKKLLAGLW